MDAQIRSTTGKSLSVPMHVRVLPAQEKRKRAIKALAFCWIAMVVTAPLPPIHWVSVPALFIAGIYMFFRKLSEKEHVEPFSFTCPECGKPIEVAARPFAEEWEQVCPSCHFSLQVQPSQAPASA